MGKAFIAGLIIFGIVLLGVGAYFLYLGFTSGGVDLEVNVPSDVELGVPFDVTVHLRNDSSGVLKDAELSMTMPKGIVLVGGSNNNLIERKELDDISTGSLYQEKFQMIVVEGGEELRKLSVGVSYSTASVGARFTKETSVDIEVVNTGLALTLEIPEQVAVGEEFEFLVKYENTTDVEFREAEITLESPDGFVVIEAEPEPDFKNIWSIGIIVPGAEGEIMLVGSVTSQNSKVELVADLSAEFLGRTYSVQKQTAEIKLASSPLSLGVTLNNSTNITPSPGDLLLYTLTYRNSSSVAFENVTAEAKLAGDMFDFTTLGSDGAFSSFERTIRWDSKTTPALSHVAPNTKGELTFRVKAKESYPIRRLNDKDFTLSVDARLESPTTIPSVVASKTVSLSTLESRMSGQVVVDAKGFFRDAAAGVINNGPLPPKVGVPTDFTIHWVLTNFSTDIRDVVIRAPLQDRVVFKKAVNVSEGEFEFNEQSGEVVWRVDRIAATRGITSAPLEVVFQVTLTPSAQYVGSPMAIVGTTQVLAIDEFTGVELRYNDVPVLTSLSDDATVGSTDGVVVQ